MRPEKARQRFPRNVEGPFFVVNGECTACMAPKHEAPDLIAFDKEARHCYFRKQPSTPEEFERATRAVWASCCGAVQYCGDDSSIYRRLEQLQKEHFEKTRSQSRQKHWWKFW